MKNFAIISLASLIPLLLFQACGKTESSPLDLPPKQSIPVKVIPIEMSNRSPVIAGSGLFATGDETLLSFKTGGIVQEILVREGDYIQKGQLLASLDLTEMDAAFHQAKLAHEKALRDYERVLRLQLDSVATQEQFENAKTGLDIAAQQLQIAQFNKDFSQIKAVKDGYILQKMANPGQQVNAGTPIFQTNGAGKTDWRLKIALSDKDWALLQEGDSALVQTETDPGKNIPAKVVQKAKIADSRTGAFLVELEIKANQSSNLASGMFGKAVIFPSITAPGWTVPYESVLDANGGKGFVFVLDEKSQTARKVAVQLGTLQADQVQIISGLEDCRQLIVSGNAYLTDQSPIQIQQ